MDQDLWKKMPSHTAVPRKNSPNFDESKDPALAELEAATFDLPCDDAHGAATYSTTENFQDLCLTNLLYSFPTVTFGTNCVRTRQCIVTNLRNSSTQQKLLVLSALSAEYSQI